MQVIPAAVGQSDGLLVFWDDQPELGLLFPRSVEVVADVRFGAGRLFDRDCLILYLFIGEQTVEIYLPESLPTRFEQTASVWAFLCAWDPEALKIRYGETPADRSKESMLLLPKLEGERLLDRLRQFVTLTKDKIDEGATTDAYAAGDAAPAWVVRLQQLLSELEHRQ
ncbi:hypothetical protein [Ferroacidibacillus organovorans]|uniref:Uncharacterized protein n=1 Tax=Ferroacidibacillus organovorans TaxID=1765683 RepID=A0A117SYI2_9BACL|nr:hypothetical protein [Ferroacidibacillus organovorans]KUO96961.1 hypothetical protein ATW55_12940 [Ferroacidibacillus organovorans]